MKIVAVRQSQSAFSFEISELFVSLDAGIRGLLVLHVRHFAAAAGDLSLITRINRRLILGAQVMKVLRIEIECDLQIRSFTRNIFQCDQVLTIDLLGASILKAGILLLNVQQW